MLLATQVNRLSTVVAAPDPAVVAPAPAVQAQLEKDSALMFEL